MKAQDTITQLECWHVHDGIFCFRQAACLPVFQANTEFLFSVADVLYAKLQHMHGMHGCNQ